MYMYGEIRKLYCSDFCSIWFKRFITHPALVSLTNFCLYKIFRKVVQSNNPFEQTKFSLKILTTISESDVFQAADENRQLLVLAW